MRYISSMCLLVVVILAGSASGGRTVEVGLYDVYELKFVGRSYGPTEAPASKQGHYFWGNYKAHEHRAADNLKWLRETIDNNITFWKMAPVKNTGENRGKAAIFTNLDKDFRAMAWPENEYVLATNKPCTNIKADLPQGKWQNTHCDVVAKSTECLAERALQAFTFDSPPGRAVLFHFKKSP